MVNEIQKISSQSFASSQSTNNDNADKNLNSSNQESYSQLSNATGTMRSSSNGSYSNRNNGNNNISTQLDGKAGGYYGIANGFQAQANSAMAASNNINANIASLSGALNQVNVTLRSFEAQLKGMVGGAAGVVWSAMRPYQAQASALKIQIQALQQQKNAYEAVAAQNSFQATENRSTGQMFSNSSNLIRGVFKAVNNVIQRT